MELTLSRVTIRSFHATDARALARHANNRRVWINLRDRFPFPYTVGDARGYLRAMRTQSPETAFALDVDGEAVGSIGLLLQQDVDRVSAEVGYWLGEAFWGRGIASEALSALSPWALGAFNLTRLYAHCFAHNVGSARVLEKSGYILEGRCRRAAIKDGQVLDQLQYARYDQ